MSSIYTSKFTLFFLEGYPRKYLTMVTLKRLEVEKTDWGNQLTCLIQLKFFKPHIQHTHTNTHVHVIFFKYFNTNSALWRVS